MARIHRVLLMALVTAFALLLPMPASAEDSHSRSVNGIQQTYWRMWNNQTGNCIVARGTGNGSPVVQWDGCRNAAYNDQRWTARIATWVGNIPYYHMVNLNSQKCLLARTADHLAVQWDCMGYADQLWTFRNDTWGGYQIINKETGRCLLVLSGGSQAFTAPCVDASRHWWHDTFD